jgi:alanyl-tRNA synthetase
LIKILSGVSHRGGVRITLICGETARLDYIMKHVSTLRIADMLAAKHSETDEAVARLLQKEKDLHYQLQKKTEQLYAYIASTTSYRKENAVFVIPGLNPMELKNAALYLKDRCGGLCVAVSGDDGTGYYFAVTSSSIKVTEYAKEITSALHGSGGGRFDVIQGRFLASEDEILSYFEHLKVH